MVAYIFQALPPPSLSTSVIISPELHLRSLKYFHTMAEPTSSRQVPMQVLALGLPRTGTSSMQAALLRLGHNDAYHSFDMLSRPQDIPL